MAEKDERGRAGEERAARYLTEAGYTIVDRNWRIVAGEIDIVAVRGRSLVVVEVKTRRGELFGHPLEAVDGSKRARLWRLAMAWRAAHAHLARGRELRVDAIGICGPDVESARIEHLEDVR